MLPTPVAQGLISCVHLVFEVESTSVGGEISAAEFRGAEAVVPDYLLSGS